MVSVVTVSTLLDRGGAGIVISSGTRVPAPPFLIMSALIGTALIAHHETAESIAIKVISAGYIKENGKPNFTAYYTALIDAKGGIKRIEMQDKVQVMMHFVEEHCSAKYVPSDMFATYYDLVQDYDLEVVDNFCHTYSVDDLESFEDSFQGIYNSESHFAEEWIDNMGETIPHYVVVDYDATWTYSLRHDYTFDHETGAVFADNF